MQTQQIAQTAMHAPHWSTIMISAAAVIIAAFGSAFMTLYWQRRREKRAEKLNLFLTLMMHRKADPPNQAWVNALNIIDVVFYDAPKVLDAWHRLYPILQDEDKTYSEERVHAYIHMLSEMASALNYPKLQQIDIDKFYSPTIYAQQAETNAQMQSDIMSFFRAATSLIPQKQGDNVKPLGLEIGILAPEEGSRVARKHDVLGYVYPPAAKVQMLVLAPGNGFWYPQAPIQREEAKWKVLATIGDENSAGHSFKLVAIVSATQITQRIKELPADAILSRIVIVTRNTESTPARTS
jgi:hypothetical protein